jgi:hypothetical protein
MIEVEADAAQPRQGNLAERWNFGLKLSIANAAFYLVVAFLFFVLDVSDITYPTILEGLFTAGSLICFFILLRSGGELAAVTFVVFSAGFYFGFGTIYSTMLSASLFGGLFSTQDQYLLLNKVNLLNAFSVVILLSTAWPLCKKDASAAAATDGVAEVIALVAPLRRPLLMLSIPIAIILFLTSFPEPQSPIWNTLLLLMQAVSDSAILLCGMQWSKLSFAERNIAVGLVIAFAAIGLLSLTKITTLVPIAALLAGLLLDSKSSARLTAGAALVLIAAFLILAILVNGSRGNFAYRPTNTLGERVAIISSTTSLAFTAVSSSIQGSSDTLQLALNVLNRFGDAPIQGYLIDQYDHGKPGYTLDDPWLVLVPRVLWPDKPDISRYGLELNAQMIDAKTQTWLAPTFDGEAYWNGGWLYVILVSVLVGLQVGWFTHKWNRFRDEGLRHVGILIFAVPVLANTALLESWVVIGYIGIPTILFILIAVGDRLGPPIINFMGGRSAALGAAG